MEWVRQKKVLPSMRAMQFAGPAIFRNNSRIYNCAYRFAAWRSGALEALTFSLAQM
jgi:hypothetical protein